ncbi:MAG: hypothetical protein JXB40_06165 [Candidatus Omnitrophica bacterium]|nr:hypothetical protein [Candidatus Omnitrophota bacterium]
MKIEEKRLTEYNRFKHEDAVSRKRNIFDAALNDINRLSKHDLKLVGIALYWAEGYKTDRAKDVEIVNSDPAMIRLMMKWFREVCNVPEHKFKVRIQIHDALRTDEGIRFWSLNTGIPLAQFTKPYIKTSPSSKGKAGNRHLHGVCHIRIADTKLLAQIKGWIEGLSGAIV